MPAARRRLYMPTILTSRLSRNLQDPASSTPESPYIAKGPFKKGRHSLPPTPDKTKVDTEDGHLRLRAGLVLGGKYTIRKMLGEGTFGRVFECTSLEKNNGVYVAAKVIRAQDKYRRDALQEVALLDELADLDPHDEHQCVRMLDCTESHGHSVLVFEALGPSLADQLLQRQSIPFSIRRIRSFGRDILRAVCFLHKNLFIHTDLKTPNVLLETSTRDCRHVKVIDFGGARRTARGRKHKSTVQTRQYRAPEVVLESGWSYACDLWSVGCILMELYTGGLLFPVHDNAEHLAMLERTCGSFPEHFASQETGYFTSAGDLVYSECTTPCRPLKEMIRNKDAEFFDIVRQMLTLDPQERITASEALRHSFFSESYSTSVPGTIPATGPVASTKRDLQLKALHVECEKAAAELAAKRWSVANAPSFGATNVCKDLASRIVNAL